MEPVSKREERCHAVLIETRASRKREECPSAHAQDIYKEAFNSAWDEYTDPKDRRGDADREETAHKVAWSAVKRSYEKGPDGDWRKKG